MFGKNKAIQELQSRIEDFEKNYTSLTDTLLELKEENGKLKTAYSELSRKFYTEVNMDNGFYFFKRVKDMKSIISIRFFDPDEDVYIDRELLELPYEDTTYQIDYTIMTEGLNYKKSMVIKVKDFSDNEEYHVYINYTNIFDISEKVGVMEKSEYELIPGTFKTCTAKKYQIDEGIF